MTAIRAVMRGVVVASSVGAAVSVARARKRRGGTHPLPTWMTGTLSEEVIERFVDHTATFALANIKDILEHGDEDNLRRLQLRAGQAVPTPVELDTPP